MSESVDDALYRAIKSGRPDEIARVIEETGDANYRTGTGETALTWAADPEYGPDGTSVRVRRLIQLGARVSEEDPKAGLGTSVHLAARSGHFETLSLLLASDGSAALAKFDDMGRTPLICAVLGGDIGVVRLLLDAGSPVDARDEARLEDTALKYAVRERNQDIIKLLLERGADPSVRGWMQTSALDLVDDEHAADEIGQLFQRFARKTPNAWK